MNQDNTNKSASTDLYDSPRKGTILILDDDQFLLGMYATKFSGAGYTVEACISGTAALEILRGDFKPDVILFDITMPELDGFSFLKTLLDEHLAPDARKIALSNQSDEREKTEALKLGAVRYIVKASMIPSEVVSAVEEELTKNKSR